MSKFLRQIRELIKASEVRISEHGYEELTEDNLTVEEIVTGIEEAVIVEEYRDYPKGRCILVLQQDQLGKAIHVVWGIPKGYEKPAVLITAYRPSLEKWDESFLRRR
ncbi:DUF4258 domain-containing protein [Euhalothece natronophila Z-M001]|uniref:DUF4258 domain-containing protein n=1 Tax=Euhalothece natronophila Z-M001 TaxID=522448 RepID=A0A5B8NL95_9CHRO|nr:DUF4258 domain-containing protein [Euhalothece natronophila]QDZ39687.1 DUF4258 domain-containing protein [Euhalothece natronophila Z-M001]